MKVPIISGLEGLAASIRWTLPKAARVERLAALKARGQVLEVVRELLVLAKLNHVIEMFHVLDDGVQLSGKGEGAQRQASCTTVTSAINYCSTVPPVGCK